MLLDASSALVAIVRATRQGTDLLVRVIKERLIASLQARRSAARRANPEIIAITFKDAQPSLYFSNAEPLLMIPTGRTFRMCENCVCSRKRCLAGNKLESK